VLFLKNKQHPTPKATWKRSRGFTCSSASTRCPHRGETPASPRPRLRLTENSLPSCASETSWSNLCFVWLTTCSTATLLMWVEVNAFVIMCLYIWQWQLVLYSDSPRPPTAVSVHASRVSCALLQSADGSSSRLRVHWVYDSGGGLPLTTLHESQGIVQMHRHRASFHHSDYS